MKMKTKYGNAKRQSRNIEDKREYIGTRGTRPGLKRELSYDLNMQKDKIKSETISADRVKRMKSEQQSLKRSQAIKNAVNKKLKW